MEPKFFEFSQNNTGGSFDVDSKVCHRVILEAEDAAHANIMAEKMGIYFNGCEDAYDCPCCGDRWYEAYSPLDFSNWGKENFKSIEEYAQYIANRYGWTKPDIRIFYLNGTIKEIFTNEKTT